MAKDEYEGSTVVAKLTVKTMGCVGVRAKVEGKSVILCRIGGFCKGTVVKTDQQGNAIDALVGDFVGVNVETGEVFTSGVCYLPAGMQEQVLSGIKTVGEGGAIRFALEISAKPDSNKAGYTYTGKQLEKPEGADPLSEIKSRLLQGFKTAAIEHKR